jgi:hypothetical protein
MFILPNLRWGGVRRTRSPEKRGIVVERHRLPVDADVAVIVDVDVPNRANALPPLRIVVMLNRNEISKSSYICYKMYYYT